MVVDVRESFLSHGGPNYYEYLNSRASQVLVEEGVGRVRYVGECHFKPGLWMGIELNHPLGTNDGSIEERRYFYTNPKRGNVTHFFPPSVPQSNLT